MPVEPGRSSGQRLRHPAAVADGEVILKNRGRAGARSPLPLLTHVAVRSRVGDLQIVNQGMRPHEAVLGVVGHGAVIADEGVELRVLAAPGVSESAYGVVPA